MFTFLRVSHDVKIILVPGDPNALFGQDVEIWISRFYFDFCPALYRV